MTNEQRGNRQDVFVGHKMTAAELYAYNSLPKDLRRRKEDVEGTVRSIASFLARVKEFGEELVELGYSEYSENGPTAYNPAHVEEREALLGREFEGELRALQIFDQVKHENIRHEVGRLGKDFVKKVTQLQQLMESLAARYNQTMLPFTRSKAPGLDKFERELRQRVNDISYLTRQHSELMAAAMDAKAGDEEEDREEIADSYQIAVMPFVDAYDALREELGTISVLSFRKRRAVLDQLNEQAEKINTVNEEFSKYPYIDFVTFELPSDDEE